ncbi:MAG: ABC transporter permease [Paraclostridium sordellii]
MGIYLKLSIAYLRKNKLRTLLLILAVALGVALIFGTSTIRESQSKNDLNAVNKLYGGYHVEFNDLNHEEVGKLKNDKDVLKTSTVQNLGNVLDKKGNSFQLKSVDENYVKGKLNKLINGRLPKNNDEIVLEKKALKAMGIPEKLNSTIDLKIKKKYKDSQGDENVYTEDKKFKLVGIIEKPQKFYDMNLTLEAFTYKNEENNSIIPEDIISYDSILTLKSGWRNIKGQIKTITKRNDLGKNSYTPNIALMQNTMEIEERGYGPQVIKNQILIVITSAILIFNIFNITLNETIKETGLLRLIGSSKRNVRGMIIYQGLIVMALGITIGLVFGLIYSYIGISKYNFSLYQEALIKPSLYISQEIIMTSIIAGIISVLASCIIPIIKVSNISIIESTKTTDKMKKHRKFYKLSKTLNNIFGFYGYMGIKNIGRNKTRAVISILSIALGGYVYLTTFSSMQFEVNNKIEDIYNKYDITMQFIPSTSDMDNLEYIGSDIDKIKNIYGVKNVESMQIVSGLFDFKKKEVNKEFPKYFGVKEQDNMEAEFTLRLYDNNDLNKNIKDFIQDGSLEDIGKVTDGYPNVAVYNYFYDIVTDHTYKDVYKNLKVGDIISVKVQTTENGETIYKENKVRVGATLTPNWMSNGDGGTSIEIITSKNHAVALTGKDKYTKLGINLKDSYDEKANKEIEKISNDIHLSRFDSRFNFRQRGIDSSREYYKSQISTIALALVIAGINIFCTIRTNLLMRKKEISTLRAIGLSIKNMKKMVLYEALTYSIISFAIALIPSIINLVKFVNWNNNAYTNFGIKHFMNFTFPVKESIVFFILSVIVCLIAVATSSRELKNMSIIEGIKDND